MSFSTVTVGTETYRVTEAVIVVGSDGAALAPGTGSGDASAANQATQIAVEGATTGAAVVTDANGTIQQYLRGLVKLHGVGTTVTTPALVASKILKNSAGTLISVTVSNTKAAAQFAQIFDSATLPADGVVPLASYKVAAQDGRSFDIPITGMAFASGIVVCNSSTQATKTIGSADCLFLAVVR